MALTQQQFDEVLAILTAATLDQDTLNETERILKCHIKGGLGDAPTTPYTAIKGYTSQYKTALEDRGSGVVQPDYEDEMMVTYMDKYRVMRVLDFVPTDGFLAAMPGVHKDAAGKEQFTISLLAANSDFTFVENSQKAPIDGEEVWGNFDILKNFATVFNK